MLNIGTLNCRGIRSYSKKQDLICDFVKHDLFICAIQETHISESDIFPVLSSDKSIYNIHTVSCDNAKHGIGFVIKEDTNCEIIKVSDRIAVAKVAFKDKGNIKLFRFINVYAPPRSRSKAYKTESE